MQRVQNLPPDTIWITTDSIEESRRTWDNSGANHVGVYGPHEWLVYLLQRRLFCILPERDKSEINMEASRE